MLVFGGEYSYQMYFNDLWLWRADLSAYRSVYKVRRNITYSALMYQLVVKVDST